MNVRDFVQPLDMSLDVSIRLCIYSFPFVVFVAVATSLGDAEEGLVEEQMLAKVRGRKIPPVYLYPVWDAGVIPRHSVHHVSIILLGAAGAESAQAEGDSDEHIDSRERLAGGTL